MNSENRRWLPFSKSLAVMIELSKTKTNKQTKTKQDKVMRQRNNNYPDKYASLVILPQYIKGNQTNSEKYQNVKMLLFPYIVH